MDTPHDVEPYSDERLPKAAYYLLAVIFIGIGLYFLAQGIGLILN